MSILAAALRAGLGRGTGHPGFVLSSSSANQTIAQIELFAKPKEYKIGAVYCCPSNWTRKGHACTWTKSAPC